MGVDKLNFIVLFEGLIDSSGKLPLHKAALPEFPSSDSDSQNGDRETESKYILVSP